MYNNDYFTGLHTQDHRKRRLLQPLERIHSLLLSSWTSHRPDLHIHGADEQSLQAVHFARHECHWRVVETILQKV